MDQKYVKDGVRGYYDQEAKEYIKQYHEGYDLYPANLIRINFIIDNLKKNNIKTVLEAGCGSCGPMIKLLKEGFSVKGFDFSRDMLEEGKRELQNSGYDPKLIYFADLENEKTFQDEKFDAILALGVFPHVLDEEKALSNMRKLLNLDGRVFIEFRNDLFASYTLNKYSLDFFLNRMINMKLLSAELQDEVINFYSERFKADKPVKKKDEKIEYTDILAKFHNPLTIGNDLFKQCDFSVENIHFYHYHALPPFFENKYPKLFRELSLELEKTNDWKGYFMASAFVVEAKKSV